MSMNFSCSGVCIVLGKSVRPRKARKGDVVSLENSRFNRRAGSFVLSRCPRPLFSRNFWSDVDTSRVKLDYIRNERMKMSILSVSVVSKQLRRLKNGAEMF